MSEPDLKVAVSATYERQFAKLKSEELKEGARKCRRELYEMLTLQRAKQSPGRVKEIIMKRRVKPIQKFKKASPKRWEATFAPDGRIVWTFDGSTLSLLYIGNHSVLDKN